jgi:hypothetical protein
MVTDHTIFNNKLSLNGLSAKSFKPKSAIMFGLNKENAQGQVTELVEKLKSQASLSDEQANQVIETIKNFVVDKYPMLSGAVNNLFK